MKLELINKKQILAIIVVAALASTMLLVGQAMNDQKYSIYEPYSTTGPTTYEYETLDLTPDGDIFGDMGLKTFDDFDDYQDFVGKASLSQDIYMRPGISTVDDFSFGIESDAVLASAPHEGGSADYSETNVQVTGVDEGDIVKNDDSHAYVVSKDRDSVYIVEVYPTDGSRIKSQILVDGFIQEIYISGDTLIIIEQVYYFEGGYCQSSYQYSGVRLQN